MKEGNSLRFYNSKEKCTFWLQIIHYKIILGQARIQGGGIWGTCPPLEPNAQRKNLRRLKDLRGQIQQKSPKFSKLIFFFFCLRHSLKSTLQFGIRKKRYMWTKSMFISRAADAFAFSRPDGLLGDLSHSIKARFWLSFYRVRERYLFLS